jgi:hypothetical protein
VIGRFTGGTHAVVTSSASASLHTGVIEPRRCPCRCCVTVLASIVTLNMRCGFTGCRSAVVTGEARADDLCMIDRRLCRLPYSCRMTSFAHGRACDVARVLAGRLRTVVASRTPRHDASVTERCRSPRDRGMTLTALQRSGDMGRRLT